MKKIIFILLITLGSLVYSQNPLNVMYCNHKQLTDTINRYRWQLVESHKDSLIYVTYQKEVAAVVFLNDIIVGVYVLYTGNYEFNWIIGTAMKYGFQPKVYVENNIAVFDMDNSIFTIKLTDSGVAMSRVDKFYLKIRSKN